MLSSLEILFFVYCMFVSCYFVVENVYVAVVMMVKGLSVGGWVGGWVGGVMQLQLVVVII